MKKFLIIISLFLITGMLAMAQTVQITGTVSSSEDGLPLPGVTIFVRGTTLGALSSEDGKYVLSAPASAKILVFSYVGYKTQEITIEGKTRIDAVLE